ncbi:MAG: HD domain-containing protein [Thaumarchaeota archaeon]|nr:HD domain-containing protein [Nitrososphaerota archaeon]
MLFEFFYRVAELKKIPRKGWQDKVGILQPESVADHSYNMAIMAMVLSDLKGLDTQKILKMSLLHDLAESVIGDLTPDEISRKDKAQLENQTMAEILSKLPIKIAHDYTIIWEEYQQGSSKEASLVHEVDRLEMALQAKKYITEGYSSDKLQTFLKTARENVKSKEVQEILDEISYK